ncbi:MAG TPA: hypothetical protein VNH18_18505, partial [Bryobacteraceae bacterium]|nr:hypothetical protein [Bryobacteraceae bacterium]
MIQKTILTIVALAMAGTMSAQNEDHKLGYDDTPSYPGSKWKVHDSERPRPAMVTPGSCNGPSAKAPSDAEVLFGGNDTSKWITPANNNGPVTWKVENGYMEVIPGKG